VRVRRWNTLHFVQVPKTLIDVVRVDDPAYPRPLLIGTTARELTTAVKHTGPRPGIGAFSGPSSARGAMFRSILASRASEGQGEGRLRG
jgi:hypothetical protein